MRAELFFKMLEEAQKLEAIEMATWCDVQAISILNFKGYEIIKNQFTNVLKNREFVKINEERKTVNQDEAAKFLFNLFAVNKGSYGRG